MDLQLMKYSPNKWNKCWEINLRTSGTLTKTFDVNGFYSLEFSKGVNGDDFGMLRIDVDGVQLVDQGLSMPNVPSIANSGCSVELSKVSVL